MKLLKKELWDIVINAGGLLINRQVAGQVKQQVYWQVYWQITMPVSVQVYWPVGDEIEG